MTFKLAAFDLEIAKELPPGETDWKAHRPLGISCADVAYYQHAVSGIAHRTWHHGVQMSKNNCAVMVKRLTEMVQDGYTLVTHNGMSFDFDILAEESGLHDECVELAMNHVDMMFMVVAHRGWRLALDTAASGMGVKGKKKQVTLTTGEVLEDMSGARAPELWARGEYQAVLEYLKEDTRTTLELAQEIERRGYIRWRARSGRINRISTRLLTVYECLKVPEPDTSWMSDPPTRAGMMAWMERV